MQARGARRSSASCARSTPRDGAPITTWRELIDLWVDIANETLIETHRTPEFLEAQRRLTRSSTDAGCRSARSPKRTARCTTSRRAPKSTSCSAPCTSCAASCARCNADARVERPPSAAKRAAANAAQPHEGDAAMPFRLQLDPAQTVQRVRRDLAAACVRGSELLRSVKDRDVADRAPRRRRRCSGRTRRRSIATSRGRSRRSTCRCWSSTASSAATRWPTCRRTARWSATCSRRASTCMWSTGAIRRAPTAG